MYTSSEMISWLEKWDIQNLSAKPHCLWQSSASLVLFLLQSPYPPNINGQIRTYLISRLRNFFLEFTLLSENLMQISSKDHITSYRLRFISFQKERIKKGYHFSTFLTTFRGLGLQDAEELSTSGSSPPTAAPISSLITIFS